MLGARLATVPPGDDDAEDDVQAAEAGRQQRVAPGEGATSATAPIAMNAIPITGTVRTEKAPPVTTPVP